MNVIKAFKIMFSRFPGVILLVSLFAWLFFWWAGEHELLLFFMGLSVIMLEFVRLELFFERGVVLK